MPRTKGGLVGKPSKDVIRPKRSAIKTMPVKAPKKSGWGVLG